METSLNSQIGTRLRQLRSGFGLSQAGLGERLGLSRSAVTQIELGNRSVTADELVRFAAVFRCSPSALLASVAGDEPARQFSGEKVMLDELVGAISDAPAPSALRAEMERLLTLGRMLKEIEEDLGVDVYGPETFAHQGARARGAWEAIHQGYFAAEDERRRMDLGSAPIRDVAETLATQRLRASALALPAAIRGLFIRTESAGSFAIVNESATPEEQRFQLLHGLAHELFDRQFPWIVCDQHNQEALHEVRANAFASRFLLPTAGVQRFLHSLGKDTLGHSLGVIEIFSDSTGTPVRETRVRVTARSRRGAWDLNAYELAQIASYFGVSAALAARSLSNMRQLSMGERDQLTAPDGLQDGVQARRAMRLPEATARRSHDPYVTRLIALTAEARRRGVTPVERIDRIAEVLEFDDEERLLLGTSDGKEQP